MQTYNDLIELARICKEQARATTSPDVAAELMRMAGEYQHRASKRRSEQLQDDCAGVLLVKILAAISWK